MFSFICLWLSLSFGANGISAISVFLEPVVAYLGPQKHWREVHINSCGVFEACGCMSGATKALARMAYQQFRRFGSLWLRIWGRRSIGANVQADGHMLSSGADEFLNRKRVPIISRPWGSKLCTVGAVDVLCVWTCLSSGPSVCFLQGLTNCFQLHSGPGHVQFLSSS